MLTARVPHSYPQLIHIHADQEITNNDNANKTIAIRFIAAPNAVLSGKLQLAKISEVRTKSQL